MSKVDAVFHHRNGSSENKRMCIFLYSGASVINSDVVFVFVPLSEKLASPKSVGLLKRELFRSVRVA